MKALGLTKSWRDRSSRDACVSGRCRNKTRAQCARRWLAVWHLSRGRNRLEALKGERAGQYSIRINDQWRICFVWREGGPSDVELVDYP
jgi:hypothetical protein